MSGISTVTVALVRTAVSFRIAFWLGICSMCGISTVTIALARIVVLLRILVWFRITVWLHCIRLRG